MRLTSDFIRSLSIIPLCVGLAVGLSFFENVKKNLLYIFIGVLLYLTLNWIANYKDKKKLTDISKFKSPNLELIKPINIVFAIIIIIIAFLFIYFKHIKLIN